MRTLAQELAGQKPTESVIRWGQIITVSPTTVRFAGDTSVDITINLIDGGYTPTVGDKVWLVRLGQTWIIAGELVTV